MPLTCSRETVLTLFPIVCHPLEYFRRCSLCYWFFVISDNLILSLTLYSLTFKRVPGSDVLSHGHVPVTPKFWCENYGHSVRHLCIIFPTVTYMSKCSMTVYGLIIPSGQTPSVYVILKKRALWLSEYFALVPAFVLNILNNIISICYCICESFSVLRPSLFTIDFYLIRDANTNSLKDTSKILWLVF